MPVVTAPGTAVVNWGSTTACFTSKFRAMDNANTNLNAAAFAACPNGFTIVAGPVHTLTVNCSLGWTGWWPDITSSYTATATISCNTSGAYPRFAFSAGQTPLEDMREALAGWTQHYAAVIETQERLATLTTPDSVLAYAREIGDASDVEILQQAIEDGSACKIVPPTLDELLLEPPFGATFAALLNDGGIGRIDSVMQQFERAVLQQGTLIDPDDLKVGGYGKSINIHINL